MRGGAGNWTRLLLAGALAWGPAWALGVPEAPLFVPMTQADGLPSSHVNALAQDASGYLWIGTQDGLARYDGVDFLVFQHHVDDPDSLPSSSVQMIFIDSRDQVWVGTEGAGVSVLDASRTHFHHYAPERTPGFALSDVWAIAEYPEGVLWLGGYDGGLHRLDLGTGAIEVLRAEPDARRGLPANHILDLMVDDGGRLMIATTQGLALLADDRFQARPEPPDPEAPMLLTLHAGPDGDTWVGGEQGLDRLADDRFEPVFAGAADQQLLRAGVMKVLHDRAGGVWIGTRAGLRHQAPGAAALRDLAAYAALPSREMVSDLLEDHEGGIWVALRNTGLVHLPPGWADFSVLRAGAQQLGGLHGNEVSDASADGQGGLWLVHRDGTLERLDAQGASTRYPELTRPPLSVQSAVSIRAHPGGGVWIGHVRGLSRLDPDRRSLQSWSSYSAADPTPWGTVDLLRLDAGGRLWVSAYGGGVQLRDGQDGRVLRSWATGQAGGLPAGAVEDIAFDPGGQAWLAGDFGLLRLDAGGTDFQPVPGVETGRLMALAFTPGGHFWVARLGYLDHYRWGGGRATLARRIGPEQGLPATEIGGLVIDPRGDLWLTSPRGLWRYSPGSGRLRQFNTGDGLPSEEFSLRPPLMTADGVLVASTMQGVVVFDPLRVGVEREPPRLVLQRVTVLRPEGRADLPPAGPLRLGWADRELSVRARFLSFSDTRANRYRFRLHGFDARWVETRAHGERVFNHLPAGRYLLDVIGSHDAQAWTAQPLQLAIEVAAPWWQQAWARAVYALLALMAVALAVLTYRQRLDRRHKLALVQSQHEWAQRASEAKDRFLATMGHEIRTPMSGVIGMTELLLRSELSPGQRDQVEAIQRSGDLMLRLVNDALDLARIEAGKLVLLKAPFRLSAAVAEVAELLRPLAQRKALNLGTRVAEGAPDWVEGDAQRVQQILLNLLGNAIKFTASGSVTLELAARTGGDVHIAVHDTGPGLDANQRERIFQRFEQVDDRHAARPHGGSGLGLAISTELAAAMGGRITLDSSPGQGSTFRFSAPLPDAAPVAGPAPAASPRRAGAALSILVVEDDTTVARVVSGMLENLGHRVTIAAHGLEALAAATGQAYALVLLDLDLPDLDGFEVASLLRAADPSPPLVALTARATADIEARVLEAGMRALLRKPVREAELAEAIARHARADA